MKSRAAIWVIVGGLIAALTSVQMIAKGQTTACGLSLLKEASRSVDELNALQISTVPKDAYRAALAYAQGAIVPQDCKKAAGLLRTAAAASFPPAETALGEMYEAGYGGVTKDDREAARLYRAAFDGGDARGTYNFGRVIAEGRAYEYGRLDASANSPGNFHNADVLHSGSGTNWSVVAAIWTQAVAKGDGLAAYGLAKLYENGVQGVAKNVDRAIQLYRVAVAAGIPGARDSLNALLNQR